MQPSPEESTTNCGSLVTSKSLARARCSQHLTLAYISLNQHKSHIQMKNPVGASPHPGQSYALSVIVRSMTTLRLTTCWQAGTSRDRSCGDLRHLVTHNSNRIIIKILKYIYHIIDITNPTQAPSLYLIHFMSSLALLVLWLTLFSHTLHQVSIPYSHYFPPSDLK